MHQGTEFRVFCPAPDPGLVYCESMIKFIQIVFSFTNLFFFSSKLYCLSIIEFRQINFFPLQIYFCSHQSCIVCLWQRLYSCSDSFFFPLIFFSFFFSLKLYCLSMIEVVQLQWLIRGLWGVYIHICVYILYIYIYVYIDNLYHVQLQ